MRWRRKAKELPGDAAGETEPGLTDDEALQLIADFLSERSGTSFVSDAGRIDGPGSLSVVLTPPEELEPGHPGGHLDLTMVLNRDRPQETSIPDCIAFPGATPRDALLRSCAAWWDSTFTTVWELMRQESSFATHLPATSPIGFPGWHTIHGGIVGWGLGKELKELQNWAADNPILPAIAKAIPLEDLPRESLLGMKLFWGSNLGQVTAEVRIQGESHAAASEALAALTWPRASDLAYVRTFALLVHPDPPA